MSMVPFLKNFVSTKGQSIVQDVVKNIVALDPDTATKADLLTMEQDLDNAGNVITRLRDELTDEQKGYDAVNSRYQKLLAAAENLQTQIDTPSTTPEKKVSLEASLVNLLDSIEHLAPELDQDKKAVANTTGLLASAEQAYKDKSADLVRAKKRLIEGKHDLEHAKLEEERAARRAADARVVAGLTQSSSSGLNTALDAMSKNAAEARNRASVNNMKSEALSTAKEAETDPNIAEALASVEGTVKDKKLSDRLAALRRQ